MKKFFEEFKAFIKRGNALDLAVAVLIGAAFQGIIASLTDNIISPIIGIFGGADFSDMWHLTLNGSTLNFGAFVTSVINFLIMALIIFIIVKAVNKVLHLKKEEPKAPTTKICPYCKTEIDIDATRCPHCTSEL